MIRRSFRIGLWVGLVAGATMAVLRMLRGREAPTVTAPAPAAGPRPASKPASEPTTAWPPLAPQRPAASTVEAPADKPSVDVVPPAEVTELDSADTPAPAPVTDVLEPEDTGALGTDAAAATPAPAKKAAKKAARKTAAKAAAPAAAPAGQQWVEPVEGTCPGTHPVKAKLSSRIFHLPGGFNYDRTIPDRCYLDAPSAEGDGFRPAKR